MDCIKLNIWQFRGLGHLILKIIFNYLSNHISNIYNKKRHYNCWTKFWDSGPSASYFSISQRAKMGYGLNILPNLCLIRILQWFHQRNQMALEFFRNSSRMLLPSAWTSALDICQKEHAHMTSDVFWAFLTYLPTLIRYFTR